MIIGSAVYLILGLVLAEYVQRKVPPEDAWIAWLLCLVVWPLLLTIAFLDRIISSWQEKL